MKICLDIEIIFKIFSFEFSLKYYPCKSPAECMEGLKGLTPLVVVANLTITKYCKNDEK